MISEYIQKIKDNGSLGVFVEVGCGMPCYNELCMHPNTASKIALYAESPNNWELNKRLYKHTDRAISAEVCSTYMEHYASAPVFGGNFILTNTVQVANDELTETHGWFGLQTEYSTKFYHFTIPRHAVNSNNRHNISERLANIGLCILASLNEPSLIDCGSIDMVLDENLDQDFASTISIMQHASYPDDDMFIFKNGIMMRANEYFREDKKPVVLFKGSFNPVHEHHLEMMELVKDKGYKVMPCISLSNFDKSKHISAESLKIRLELLQHFGYDVIIDTRPKYYDTFKYLTFVPSLADREIAVMMGADIIPKFLDVYALTNKNYNGVLTYDMDFGKDLKIYFDIRPGYELDIEKYNFANLQRIKIHDGNDISSSSIRQNLEQSKYSEIYKKIGYKDL